MEHNKICSYQLLDADTTDVKGKLIYVRPIYADPSNLHLTISNVLKIFGLPDNNIVGFEKNYKCERYVF